MVTTFGRLHPYGVLCEEKFCGKLTNKPHFYFNRTALDQQFANAQFYLQTKE